MGYRDDVREVAEAAISRLDLWLSEGRPLCVALSWGKDSTAVLVLLLEAMRRRKDKGQSLPCCYAITSDTTIENPALAGYFEMMGGELERYCIRAGLPLEYRQVTPPLSATFSYVTVGRGKLPRYPGMSRDCSVDWKIQPINKAKRAIEQETGQPIITLVGTRISESAERAERMQQRGDTAASVNTGPDGDQYATPIAEWELEDVWGLLTFCDQREGRQLYQTFTKHFDMTVELYRDANGGECVAGLGDKHLNTSACGARFGCYLCVATGEQDKSMRSMIATEPDKHGHLEPLSRIRDWLSAIRWDMERREWLGRSINPKTNHIGLHPDYFNQATRRELLRYLLSADADEAAWADEYNEGFVRFTLVPPWQLVIIDFIWSIYRDAPHAFSALREYYLIHHAGRRYYPPADMDPAPKVTMPGRRWFALPDQGVRHPYGLGGLYDPYHDAVNRARGVTPPEFKDRVTGKQKQGVNFELVPEMNIDKTEALLFLQHFVSSPLPIECTGHDPGEAIKLYLDQGIVKLSKGQAGGLDEIMQRAEFWTRLQQQLNVPDIQAYAMANSISDAEHRALLGETSIPVEIQLDLFDAA